MKIIYTLLLSMFCLVFSNAQDIASGKLKNKRIKLGVEGGINAGAFYGTEFQDGDTGTPGIGLNAGVYTYLHIIGDIDLRPSLKYSYTGASFYSERELLAYPAKVDGFPIYTDVFTVTEGDIDIHYIELPLEFVLSFGNRLAMQLGPRFAYLLNGNVEGTVQPTLITTGIEADLEQLSDHLVLNENAIDFRVGLGLSYKLSRKMQVGATLVVGMNKFNSPTENYTDELKNVFASSYVAYNIFGNYWE